MKGQKVLFSSQKYNWETPEKFYKELNKEFDFNFDPCPKNPKFDGLAIKWKERNFINPPYNKIKDWIIKGVIESLEKKLCIFLLPARTDRDWFHNYCLIYAKEIRFIRGRLKFKGAKWYAPFPSMIVIFDGRKV